MKKRFSLFCAAAMIALAAAAAWSGDPMHAASGAEKMAMIKGEMMKCSVCKNMAVHMDEFGPAMTMDVAMLDDGVAILHGVSDPAKVALFHQASQATVKAGATCATMSDDQAKAELCGFCQELRGIMKAGGKMSSGETKTGDIMVITSSDPTVKTRIDALGKHCAMMSEMM